MTGDQCPGIVPLRLTIATAIDSVKGVAFAR